MYNEAKQAYQQIVQDFGNDLRSTQAYNKLFTIEKMTSNTAEPFNQLRDFYQAKLTTIQDSVLIGSLTHLSNLCLVAAAEYQNAIGNFDEIVQANQNTDVALYREIDALTTALLIPQDSSLGKGILGKYAVKDISDYTDKVNSLLKQRNSKRNYNEKPVPKKYSLLQNYPNPFNPSTTIKYSIVIKGEVKLTIYDILGREVSVLVNEVKDPGYYEVNFNASNLASGVYFYRLVAGNFVSTRKMLLLK